MSHTIYNILQSQYDHITHRNTSQVMHPYHRLSTTVDLSTMHTHYITANDHKSNNKIHIETKYNET